MMKEVMYQSQKSDWNTPESLLKHVYAFWPDGVSLDPCSNSTSIVVASLRWDGSEGQNGLTKPWEGRVFVNPPYGREITDWIEKIQCEVSARDCEVLVLVPARTDTRWWHLAMKDCRAVCFLKGRLKFVGAPHVAPFPSAVVYWGRRTGQFWLKFRETGVVVEVFK
jgi:hypothetical protein